MSSDRPEMVAASAALDAAIREVVIQQNLDAETTPGVVTHFVVLAVETKYGDDGTQFTNSHAYSGDSMPDWQRIGLLETYLALFRRRFVDETADPEDSPEI